MEFAELQVEQRQKVGKNEARKLRAAGKVPAVVYGDGKGAMPLIIDRKAFKSVVQNEGLNVIFKLKGLAKTKTAMIKDIQRNPLKGTLVHVDFKVVAMDEAIEAAVPLELVGESLGVNEGGVLQQALREIMVKALPNEIPEKIQMDISELNIGDSLRISDLPAFDNVEVLHNEEDQVASVVPPTELKEEEIAPVEEAEEELEEAEEGEEAAEEGEEEAKEEGKEEEGSKEKQEGKQEGKSEK